MYTHMHILIYICTVYICIERERERYIDIDIDMLFVCLFCLFDRYVAMVEIIQIRHEHQSKVEFCQTPYIMTYAVFSASPVNVWVPEYVKYI